MPSYQHLKVFGSLCFASTFTHNRTKFSPRAHRCVFLGYSFRVKGYKLYDLDAHVFLISIDATFHEDTCSYKSSSSTLAFDNLFKVAHSHELDTSSLVLPNILFELVVTSFIITGF